MSEEEVWVFVYGTLKRRHGNHIVMERARGTFICEAQSEEKLDLITGMGVPWVIQPSDQTREGKHIRGELYRVPRRGLEGPLDSLEGHPWAYRREQAWFTTPEGTRVRAWIYFMSDDGRIKLPPSAEEYAGRRILS